MRRLFQFGFSLLTVCVALGHVIGSTRLSGNHNQTALRG
jgi:hypothetical protein